MANTKYTGLTNYANYHTFSKLQVGNNVNFGGSINRSGHTVTNTDAWLDDVPFFNTFTTPSAALSAVGTSTVKNDLVSIAVGEGDIPAGLYRRNTVDNTAGDKTFTEIFTLYTIGTDKKDEAPVLLNKNDKAVVRVWTNQELTLLDGNNNSNANSEGQAARIIVNNAPVEQFIAVPDVCRSGYPSNGYSIKVYNDGTPMTMDFGTVTNTFFDVPFAGVIMFGGGTDGSVYTIDCFEYIGDKLAAVNTKIADIQETIENLTVEAGEGIKQIKPAEGSGITVATEGVEGATALTPVIGIDTNVIATKASVDAVVEDVSEIQQTIESGVVSSVTASAAAQTAGITVGGTDTEREIQVAVGEVSDTSNAVVTGKAVATALSEAQAAIKVTTDDHATRIGKLESNEAGYATTAEVATAKSEAIAAAKTETETQVGAAKSEIKTTTDDHETRIVAIENAYATSESVTALGNTSLATTSTEEETYQVKVSTTGTVATGLSITVDTKDIASAAALSALDTKVTEHIELAAGTYLEVEVVDSLDSVTEPKTNKLYLVPNTGKGNNVKDEYIYTNNTWELIGTTEVDLTPYAKTADVNTALALKADQTALDSTNTEVAKKANSADVYTKTEIDTAQEATDAAIEAAAAKGQQGITDAATAKSAADAAQADATQALTNAATAQGEVDALEGIVSALSQVVADNKTATDAAIATKADQTALDATNTAVAEHTTAIETLNDTTIPAITGRLDDIEAIPTAEVVAAEGTEEAPNYVTVSPSTVDGKTTFTVASTAALEERLDTLDKFISGSDGEGISELLAKKVDNVTGGSNGVTIATADTADGRVATLSVTPDTTVTKDSINVVTSGAVETAISTSASSTLDSAKSYAEEQVEALAAELNAGEVSANNTAVSVTQTNGKITAVTVTKGEIADKNANLIDGGTVYAVTSALETAVGKKLDSSTYIADKEAIDGRLDTAEGEIDTLQEFVNGANDAYAAKSTETAAANAQTSADKKLASITTSDTRIILGTPTADNDTKSQSISLASYVATVDSSETTADGTVYTKAQTDTAISTAVGTAVQSVSLDEANTQTAISVVTSDANAVTLTVADNIATVDKVTVAEDGTITVNTEGDVYSKESIDKMVTEAAPANYVTSINGSTGAKAFTINDDRKDVYPNDLWGTTVDVDDNGIITVQGGPIDGTAWGPKNGYNTKNNIGVNGTDYPQGSKPITKVENNMVYNGTTEVANIKTNEIVNGSHMFPFTTLESFSGDLSNLINGHYMFYCSSLASFSSDLSSLINGRDMFYSTLLTSFNGDLISLVNGTSMFATSSLKSFNGNLSSLVNSNIMFYNTSLASFNGDLSSLVNGHYMFNGATTFKSFNGDLSSLVNGAGMFSDTSLELFSGDLSSLINSRQMFSETSLASFNGDLSNLVDGMYMFNSATTLASFNGDLSSLVNGAYMFNRATTLASFNGDLSSLVDGAYMFSSTSLNIESVELICDVLPNYNTENGGKTLQTATWNESGENKGKYTYSDWSSGRYYYPIIKITDNNNSGSIDGIDRSFGTDYIEESNVKTITITWSDISVLSEDDRTAITKLFSDTATEKGWTFITNTELGGTVSPNAVMTTDGTIQYYILAKKDEATEDNATHIDASGKLWKFDTAEAIIGPNIKYWSIFATVEDALTEWELTPWTKLIEEETEA